MVALATLIAYEGGWFYFFGSSEEIVGRIEFRQFGGECRELEDAGRFAAGPPLGRKRDHARAIRRRRCYLWCPLFVIFT